MTSGGRRKSVAFFIVLGVCLAGGALALNVGWIIVSWENVGLLLVGILVFPLVITGVVLNTVFLVREIRRNEQHEAFINASRTSSRRRWRRCGCTCRRCRIVRSTRPSARSSTA